MDILYKFLVEDNIEKIKENVSARDIRDKLYELQLIDRNQHQNFLKVTNEESLDCLFRNLSLHDESAQKYKQFVENILQKQYDWIYKELLNSLTNNDWQQNKYKDILNFGDFPRKPAHYVERTDKITQVQDCLKRLSTVGKVILCGMTGSGKTSLVVGVMTMEMVLEIFGGQVFWITVGDTDDEQLLILLSKFYLKLTNDNEENLSLFNSKEFLKDKLKKKIRENANNGRMLLILDNVCNENAVHAFDIGCKTLITTQKKNIWKYDSDTESIMIDGSFKYNETCALFAKCLDRPVSYVQRITEVQKIHELCQGHPFSIALFGSQIATFRETLLDCGSKKWQDFVEMLQKNYSNQQNTVISSCIQTLDNEIRNRYSDFSIFPDDVNIASKVLEIMWDLNEFQVREIMKQLEDKSLIVSYYSNNQHNYIFGIHVVLLAYLKNKYKNELKVKHQRLIDAYKRSCNGDFSRLTNDNYIYQYIGYHLKQADSIKDFKIYFDLKFIGAKIKATGIGDILKDFNIYRKEIQEHTMSANNSIVTEIENFIKKFGDDLYKHEDISIVQCALKYSEDSFIYKTALEIANSANSSLYFKIKVPPKKCDNHVDEFQLPENCTFVCFARDEHQLLIGTKEGVIQLWDRTYKKLVCKFVGHNQSIKYIELGADGNKFLSVSDDGIINLWRFRPNRMPSTPSLAQTDHKIFFGEEQTIMPFDTFTPDEGDHFVSASFCNNYSNNDSIVIGSSKGHVLLSVNENRTFFHLAKGLPVNIVKFSVDDSLIICVCRNELFILTKNFRHAIFKSTITDIIELLTLERDGFITVCNHSISLWNFVTKRMPKDELPEVTETIIDIITNQEFCCAFMDNNVLYALTVDYKINMYDTVKPQRLRIINTFDTEINDFITAVDVYPFEYPNQSLFLLKYKNNVIKFYTLKTLMQNNRKRDPIFDCYWTDTQVRLANVTSNNAIQISNNFNILNALNVDDLVTAICFSPCGNLITYGMESGKIVEYDIKINHKNNIMMLNSPVAQLKYVRKDILVASGKRGDLMTRYNCRNICLVTYSEISKITPEPIIETFYVDEPNILLAVSKDRVIKTWNLSDGAVKVLKGPKRLDVTHAVQMSALSRNYKFLVVTMSNMFDLFLLSRENEELNLRDFGGAEVDQELYSCCFSHDSKYLALGAKSGVVIIYYNHFAGETFQEHTRLYSHTSVVRHITFSSFYSNLLVTVGEQIVWWNLNKIPANCITRNRRSRRGRPPNEDAPSIDNLFISHGMNHKIGSENKPHLLRAVKLIGSYANAAFVSPNFKTFVTKDSGDIIYIMEMIE